MMQITVDDVTYTFTEHALIRMAEEEATWTQIEEALGDPDRMEVSRSSGWMVYMKRFESHKPPLVVVIDEENQKIVTLYWSNP